MSQPEQSGSPRLKVASNAAGRWIVEEAGAPLRDEDGNPYEFETRRQAQAFLLQIAAFRPA